MTPILYAIGDVHGRDDLLEAMHERIDSHRRMNFADREAVLIHVGDYVDRGPDSIEVIDRLMRGVSGFGVVCLKGNHEDMMLACLDSDQRGPWLSWMGNGGGATLASLGVATRFGTYEPDTLREALGKERIAWLKALPLYHVAAPYLFVHAGILPGLPIEKQQEKDLLWIRSRFLDSEIDHGYRVVHGHTPSDAPEVRFNRIGIDTGAPITGTLTGVVLDGDQEPQFLAVHGAPAR